MQIFPIRTGFFRAKPESKTFCHKRGGSIAYPLDGEQLLACKMRILLGKFEIAPCQSKPDQLFVCRLPGAYFLCLQ